MKKSPHYSPFDLISDTGVMAATAVAMLHEQGKPLSQRPVTEATRQTLGYPSGNPTPRQQAYNVGLSTLLTLADATTRIRSTMTRGR